jgi:hypothetical protein
VKKFVFGGALLIVVFALVVVFMPSFAASARTNSPVSRGPSVLKLEHQVGKPGAQPTSNAFKFTCPGANKGNLLVNVTESVINDADSGQAGNYWALDAFSRTIKVWNVGSDTYCAVVQYNGTFAAQPGQKSPGSVGSNGGILTGDEVGTIKGGYEAQITGPLDVSDPTNWPLVGKVNQGNAVDYQCVINPDGSDNGCPGAIDWTSKYFDQSSQSFSFNENPWGWTYVGHDKAGTPDAGKADGVWVNASTGNSGDILDVD